MGLGDPSWLRRAGGNASVGERAACPEGILMDVVECSRQKSAVALVGALSSNAVLFELMPFHLSPTPTGLSPVAFTALFSDHS